MSYDTLLCGIIYSVHRQTGFTAIELIVAIIILLGAGFIFLFQKNDIQTTHRDSIRKISINAIHYNLEEIVYPVAGGYPKNLNTDKLRAMDSDLLKDPMGTMIGDKGSDFSYEPSSCNGEICAHYTLRSNLEKEADFTKKSRH